MHVPLEIRNHIDDLCDEFDRTWSGSSPRRMDDLMARVSVEHQALLLRELVQIDRERCLAVGQKMDLQRFEEHFSEHRSVFTQVAADIESAHSHHNATPHANSLTDIALDVSSQDTIDAYEIQERIGEGGMGVVFRARHRELGRTVALKIVAFEMGDAVARLQAEARTIAGLNHPNIVQIFGTGEYKGHPYLALEMMSGGSLEDMLRVDLPSPTRSAKILLQITEAIVAAHEIDVIHRDLKPANVLLDSDGDVKLADFGLARNLNLDSQTVSGTLLGTPGFMSPEQTMGADPAAAMDIYGLGAILYASLTGRPPFRGANIPDTLAMVRDREPVSVRSLVPSVPIDIESVCLKCLRKNPAARYGTAEELAKELRAFLAGDPVTARPPGRAEKLWRWCTRHPTIAALSTVLCATVVLGIAGIFWQWQRAEGNAARFERAARRARAETIRAEGQAQTTDAVNRFLRQVISAIPGRSHEDEEFLEALNDASAEMNKWVVAHPETEAVVSQALGKTYRAMGEFELSQEKLRLAVEIFRSKFGTTDERTLLAMDQLAGTLRSIGKSNANLAEAQTLRTAIVEAREDSLGKEHPLTLSAMNNLATVLLEREEFDRAEELYQAVISLTGRHPESSVRDAVPARFNLANVYFDRGDVELAAQETRDIIVILKDELGVFDSAKEELLNAENLLAGILRAQQKYKEACAKYAYVLKERQTLLGNKHRLTLSTQRRLTRLLVECKDYAAALPILYDCLEKHNNRFGKDRSLTFGVRKSIARSLIGLERNKQAEAFLRETVDILTDRNDKYTQEARGMLDEFLASQSTAKDESD